MAEVRFSLTEENLRRHFIGRRSYTRTKYCAITNGTEWSLVRVIKKKSSKLFHEIEQIEFVSGPDRTSFVEEPGLDVLNLGDLLSVQANHPDKLVIVRGRFEHVSFTDVRLPMRIRLIDVVPPYPSKLEAVIGGLLGENTTMIDLDSEIIDLSELVEDCPATGPVMLPCRASYEGLRGLERRDMLFLDQAPDLSSKEAREMHLIGCPLSERIFEEIYRTEPTLHNICPLGRTSGGVEELPTITRCCKVKNGVEVEGRTAAVPWGADACEIAEALRAALSMD